MIFALYSCKASYTPSSAQAAAMRAGAVVGGGRYANQNSKGFAAKIADVLIKRHLILLYWAAQIPEKELSR